MSGRVNHLTIRAICNQHQVKVDLIRQLSKLYVDAPKDIWFPRCRAIMRVLAKEADSGCPFFWMGGYYESHRKNGCSPDLSSDVREMIWSRLRAETLVYLAENVVPTYRLLKRFTRLPSVTTARGGRVQVSWKCIGGQDQILPFTQPCGRPWLMIRNFCTLSAYGESCICRECGHTHEISVSSPPWAVAFCTGHDFVLRQTGWLVFNTTEPFTFSQLIS